MRHVIAKLRKRRGGFTLIELMIVVAIIGILAAIAIPNFLRFQLRARASEGKTNLAAIRTAEEGYYSEFSTYVAASANPSAIPGTSKAPWGLTPGAASGFNTIGWAPTGEVFFQYQVLTNATSGAAISYTAEARSDLDGDGVNNVWGYVQPAPGQSSGVAGTWGCAATGVWDPVNRTSNLLSTVGPCSSTAGQSVF